MDNTPQDQTTPSVPPTVINPGQPNPPLQPVAAAPESVAVPTAETPPVPAAISPSQVVVSPDLDPTPQAPVSQPQAPGGVVFGHNSQSSIRRSRKGLIVGGVAVLLVLVGGLVYFWYLPTQAANKYLSDIKPAYEDQASKLKTAYGTFQKPVFTNNDSTPEEDAKDLADIKSATDAAVSSTDALQKKNHLKLLPGTAWLPSVSKAGKQSKALEQYTSDSTKFLKDYKLLGDYLGQFDQTFTPQLDQVGNALGDFGAATTPAKELAGIKDVSAKLTAVIDSLKKLNPPPDLKQLNDNLINGLDSMNKAAGVIAAGLSSRNQIQVEEGYNQLLKSESSLSDISATDINNKLQHDSQISKEIETLKSAKPLN
jgi:hypothetical protein